MVSEAVYYSVLSNRSIGGAKVLGDAGETKTKKLAQVLYGRYHPPVSFYSLTAGPYPDWTAAAGGTTTAYRH